MLALRPNCEHCALELPPNSTDAMICSFECTFCKACVDKILHNVCPNCGGGFVPRPVRPENNWRDGNTLGNFPASTKRVYKRVDLDEHAHFAAEIMHIAPECR